jgi:hypothetical protein
MPRPTPTPITGSVQGWDALINNFMDLVTDAPFPIKEYANAAALPAASAANERCVAITVQPPQMWISNGSAWLQMAPGLSINSSELTLAGATTTFANAFPAKVRQIGVSGRVTQLVTSGDGADGLIVGDHGAADPDRYTAAIAFALNTVFEDAATADPGGWNAAARDIVVTATTGGAPGGTFSGGKVRLFAFYIATKAPVS